MTRASSTSPRKDSGTILLTTLLIMSIMAALAVVMVEDILLAVKRTGHIDREAQASWYIQGADDYTQSYLENFIAADNPSAANAQLLQGVNGLFPIDGGVMSFTIRDSSNCLSLELLRRSDGAEYFQILFETLGWEPNIAASHAVRLTDWADDDERPAPQNGAEDFYYLGLPKPYRAANAPFTTVFEMRGLDIFQETEFQFLRPYICARKPSRVRDAEKINLNTLTPAQAPLLAVALGSADHLQLALRVINSRPPEGWPDLDAFWLLPELEDFEQNDSFASALLTLRPHHIWADVIVTYRETQKRASFEYSVTEQAIEKTYCYFGDEAHWPLPINLLEDEPL
jgi:general secretion pathway protein K